MSLQNLKTAFSNLNKSLTPEGRHNESPTTNVPFIPNSIMEATTYAYNSVLGEPIDEDGGIAPVNFPLMTDLFNNPETTTTLNDPSSDIRFQVGLGFPSPNTKLVLSREGVEASIAYFQTSTGDMMLAASGAITKLGDASEKLAKVGIDLPTFDFGVQVKNPFSEGTFLGDLSKPDPVPVFLKYENQVEEMFNATNENLTDEFVNTGNPDSTRGIVFQVLGDQNKEGMIPDFRFQDKVANEKTVEYINPVVGFTPGNIQFKDNYFKDIGQSLGGLANALGPGEGIGDVFGAAVLGGALGALGGISGPGALTAAGIKFISENDLFKEQFSKFGDVVRGFGAKIPLPKFPKIDIDIDFGAAGDFFSGIGDSVKGFASGIGSKFNDSFGGVTDTLKDIGGPIANAFKDVAANLSPLDEFELPQIELQNPRQVSVTEYGGQAIFRANTPRALSRNITRRATAPSETKDRAYKKNDVSTPYSKLGDVRYAGIGELGKLRAPRSYYPNAPMDELGGGDQMTNMDVKGPTLEAYDTSGVNKVDSEDFGYPFFFKDLRTNNFIIFRGYLSGISENIAPSWSEQSYIGRSEKNWIYQGADRSISFTFKLAAQTAKELDSIYQKLSYLTGLSYPEYMTDMFLNTATERAVPRFKTRMRPPLARMRLGDLYGNPYGKTREGILGFVKSLSYTFPDESPWETRHGQRVPKIIDVSAEWQVIHEEVPSMDYPEFYGYNPKKENEVGVGNQSNTTAEELAQGLI